MTSPLRRKRPTTVRGRNTPIWKATRYAWPLAALAALLAGGTASAQPLFAPPPPPVQRPLPAAPAPVATPTSSPRAADSAPALMPYGAGFVQPAALQRVPAPVPPDQPEVSNEYADILELPGPRKVFGALDS